MSRLGLHLPVLNLTKNTRFCIVRRFACDDNLQSHLTVQYRIPCQPYSRVASESKLVSNVIASVLKSIANYYRVIPPRGVAFQTFDVYLWDI